MRKKKDFQWRYQISLDSSFGILLDYIQQHDLHPTNNKKEMILQALSAYYMPLAYFAAQKQPEQIQQIAYDSVLALQRQIDRLVSQFQLDVIKLGIYNSELEFKKSNQELKNSQKIVSAPEVVEAKDDEMEVEIKPEAKFNLTGLFDLTSQEQ